MYVPLTGCETKNIVCHNGAYFNQQTTPSPIIVGLCTTVTVLTLLALNY